MAGKLTDGDADHAEEWIPVPTMFTSSMVYLAV